MKNPERIVISRAERESRVRDKSRRCMIKGQMSSFQVSGRKEDLHTKLYLTKDAYSIKWSEG